MRGSHAAIQKRFIALLKPPFKSSDDYRHIGWAKKTADCAKAYRDHKARQAQQA